MDEIEPQVSPAAGTGAASLRPWFTEGLRAGFLLPARVSGEPAPWHVLVLLLLSAGLSVGLERLEIAGPATFNAYAWLGSWWTAAAVLLLVWAVLWRRNGGDAAAGQAGVASWFALWLAALLPFEIATHLFSIAQGREMLPKGLRESGVFQWGTYLAFWGWMIAVALGLGRRFGLKLPRLVVLAAGLAAIYGVMAMYSMGRAWYPDEPYKDDEPRLSLSQESFERQQAVWRDAVKGLAAQRPGVRDVYGIVFAPYAREDVFLHESTMVADLLVQRFDAQGRVLHLANHASTDNRLPWATPLNLRRGIEAVAQRMDREKDLLVVYLTSHGGSNFQLSASHWPLQVDPLSPAELRKMLDDAGIRNRVIAISACYSGGWIGPLASDTSLVMTAADADHTSYGCGRRSPLTFFGRAMFDEQLRTTHSFEEAFAAAVPVIKQREIEGKKADGFSNPQISVGGKIRPVLQEIAHRLDGAPKP